MEGASLLKFWDDPPTLDPHLAGDATSGTIIVEVFGGLVTIEPDLRIVPDLAETWDIINGGTTYVFHLRKGGKFHDGKPVTAHDFKWSLERAADPATRSLVVDTYLGDIVGVREKLSGQATEIAGVRVIDAHTLEITIDVPKAYFLAKLTYPTAFVLDRENVESDPEWFLQPNSTGPFKLTRYVPRELVLLERNENYHLGPPKLQEVQFILSDINPILLYLEDRLHIINLGVLGQGVVADPQNPLARELRRSPPRLSVGYFGMNVNEPPFDDPKVRQALNHAIDRERISRELYQDALPPANSILPPGFPGHDPQLKGYSYDPERALQLIEESKYGNDSETLSSIVLTLPGFLGAPVSRDIEAILDMWRENLGVHVEIRQTDWATYLQDLSKLRFHMFGGSSWVADYPDPENFLDGLFHTDSSNNQTGYSNPEVDRLLEQARVETDETVRYELYHLAENLILEDAPWVLLWHSGVEHVLVKPYVKDYLLTSMTVPVLRHVYITEK